MSRDRSALSGDTLVVGSGLIGAVCARLLVEAGLRVVMVEQACVTAGGLAMHVYNARGMRVDARRRHAAVAARLRPLSGWPGAATCDVAGGMGTVWTGLAPRLDASLEPWDLLSPSAWQRCYDRAEELLSVGADRTERSACQAAIAGWLARRPIRATAVRPAALAARPPARAGGWLRFTGPGEILAPLGGKSLGAGGFTLLYGHVARRLSWRGDRVVAAEVVSRASRQVLRIEAGLFIVAAGALGTPQLLWASGILRDDRGPLGRGLTDHPLAFARVALRPEIVAEARAGRHADAALPAYLSIPLRAEQPFLGYLLQDRVPAREVPESVDVRSVLNLYWYARAEPRWRNRLRFGEGRVDGAGLPVPVVVYRRSAAEEARARAALQELTEVGRVLGTFLPSAPPRLLPPGSSMHVMGTTRAGRRDDGRSVADGSGRVRGFSNLVVGGTGLIGCATANNPTLTAAALAVHSVEAWGLPVRARDGAAASR